jgi:hypothetical protein
MVGAQLPSRTRMRPNHSPLSLSDGEHVVLSRTTVLPDVALAQYLNAVVNFRINVQKN